MGKRAALQAGELDWYETRFVENYITNGGNATQAYIAAGFSRKGANSNASRLLAQTRIQDAIKIDRERHQSLLNFKREDALKILIGIATASLDDFAAVSDDLTDRENYKSLGYKRFALQSAENTKEGVRIKLHDKREALNDLWEKLGLGEGTGSGNWFDGFEQLAELVRGTAKKK